MQSQCRPPGLQAVLLRRLSGLVHQSQGSEPFTSFSRDLPQCWASSLNQLENLRTCGRQEGGGMDAIHRMQTADSLLFSSIGVYAKKRSTSKAKTSWSFPANYFLTFRHRTNWKTEQTELFNHHGLSGLFNLHDGRAISSWPLSQFLIGTNNLKGSHFPSKQNVSLAKATLANLARLISHSL